MHGPQRKKNNQQTLKSEQGGGKAVEAERVLHMFGPFFKYIHECIAVFYELDFLYKWDLSIKVECWLIRSSSLLCKWRKNLIAIYDLMR